MVGIAALSDIYLYPSWKLQLTCACAPVVLGNAAQRSSGESCRKAQNSNDGPVQAAANKMAASDTRRPAISNDAVAGSSSRMLGYNLCSACALVQQPQRFPGLLQGGRQVSTDLLSLISVQSMFRMVACSDTMSAAPRFSPL